MTYSYVFCLYGLTSVGNFKSAYLSTTSMFETNEIQTSRIPFQTQHASRFVDDKMKTNVNESKSFFLCTSCKLVQSSRRLDTCFCVTMNGILLKNVSNVQGELLVKSSCLQSPCLASLKSLSKIALAPVKFLSIRCLILV